jgi:uncharacterized Tic20 family protein
VTETVPVPSSDARTWAMLSHLAGLANFTTVPFGNILAPLIIYFTKKDVDPFIDEHVKESLNFQISVTIVGCFLLFAYVATFFVAIIGTRNAWPWPLIVIVCLVLLLIFDVVNVVVAAIRSYNGEHVRYPVSFRFLR